MGLIIAAAFLAGSIFTCLIVWLFMKGAHVDDPMDEAEANAPRDKFSCGYCGGSVDSRVLLPRRSVREQKPSGRKHFADVQNGSPLPKYEADWESAMRRTDESLSGIKPSQELQEYVAKVLEEVADNLDYTEPEAQLRRMAEEWRKK